MLPLKREDYKAIKHMNKNTMERYLNGIYQRGYSDGATDMAREQKAERDKELAQQSEATEPAGEVQP
ncbi:MAG: hypothetical protein K2O84_06170 [Oscillospiraceae bacterium]|mgnify:FL=1|jgi:hypothetical protein|nr:hypothetical protein [Oscillospiraceae bacterium]MDE7054387.1 hypothetical protein [Oscillospiraceae bacterium]